MKSYKELKEDFHKKWKQPIQDLYKELESRLLRNIVMNGVEGVWIPEDFPITDYGYYVSKVVFNESDEVIIYIGQKDGTTYTEASLTSVSLKFFGSIIPTSLVDEFWKELIPLAKTVGHPLLPILEERSIVVSEYFVIKSLLMYEE